MYAYISTVEEYSIFIPLSLVLESLALLPLPSSKESFSILCSSKN